MPGSVRRRLTAPLAALVLTSTVLAGCSSGSEGSDAPAADATSASPSDTSSDTSSATEASESPEATATASGTPYLPVPDDVELTAQGSELEVGESAVVAWEPRQDLVGVLEVTVRRLERTSFKESFEGWKLDKQAKASSPYFVRAKVENVGETDLGGRRVPLYIVDGQDTLVEYSTFASTFRPCDSTNFPKKFPPGAKREVCLVYLSPDRGDLTAVSFRPTQEFNPITWTGKLEKVKGDKPRKKSGGKGKAKGSGGTSG